MLPPWAWIAIVAIIVWGLIALVSVITGRGLSGLGEDSSDEVDALKQRVRELEAQRAESAQLEEKLPTRAEENLSAEDRWRLDMLEARLEEIESQKKGETDKDADTA